MRAAVRQSVVHWEAAQAAAGAAVRAAEVLGIQVNAAVCDSGGNLVAFLRMPGAFLPSIDIALDKAYTAAGFGLSPRALGTALAANSPAVREGIAKRLRVAAFAGGLPILVEGERGAASGYQVVPKTRTKFARRPGWPRSQRRLDTWV